MPRSALSSGSGWATPQFYESAWSPEKTCSGKLAADAAHRARRLAEARLGNAVLELLAPHGRSHRSLQLGVIRSGSKRRPQVRFVEAEEAGTKPSVGGEPDPVASRA